MQDSGFDSEPPTTINDPISTPTVPHAPGPLPSLVTRTRTYFGLPVTRCLAAGALSLTYISLLFQDFA
jgi:hypothetical protein